MAQNDPDFKGAWNDVKNGVPCDLSDIFKWEGTIEGIKYWAEIHESTRHIIEQETNNE